MRRKLTLATASAGTTLYVVGEFTAVTTIVSTQVFCGGFPFSKRGKYCSNSFIQFIKLLTALTPFQG